MLLAMETQKVHTVTRRAFTVIHPVTIPPCMCPPLSQAMPVLAATLQKAWCVCRHWEYLGTCMLTTAVLLGSQTTLT